MQTRFSAEQLADPGIASSEAIIRKCVHCGFCTATCPTYVLLGDELDSPRGRIYLIKDMLEHGRPATAHVVRHLDRCLSCLACVTTCPSGVDYQHLIDHARAHVERTYRRPLSDRFVRALLAVVLPSPARLRLVLALAALARPLRGLLPRRLRAMLALARRPVGAPARSTAAGVPAASSETRLDATRSSSAGPATGESGRSAARSRRRVAVLTGCVQSVVGASINAATFRLLERAGVETVAVDGCCGSIVHHLGRDARGRALAATLIDKLHSEIETRGLDAVAINASGCGTHVKDLGFIFRNDARLAARAAAISALARDVTEVLLEVGLPEVVEGRARRVAYHSACSMQHGQKLETAPRALLRAAGFDVAEIPEGHLCCGSAGTYNMLQPELAERLRERKLAHIDRTGADLVATGNLGCIMQLGHGNAGASARPIVHTVALLDWATGGPPPATDGA